MRRLAGLGLLCALAALVVLAQVNVGGAPGFRTSSDGASFWSGTVQPSNVVGVNGDFYLNTSSYCLYGPKAAGAWPASCTSLIGPAGAPGAALGYIAENASNKDVPNGYAPLDGSALLPIAKLPNPKVTAGTGGVTAGFLVAQDTGDPTHYIAPGAGSCGAGFAASTAAAGVTFQLYSIPGTLITAVADNNITAGDLVSGGSVVPGRLADSGFSARSSIPTTTCIIGVAQTSAVAGGTFTVLYDGTGSYGTLVTASSVTTGLGYTPAPTVSPAFTGAPTAPTQAPGDTSINLATDAFVAAAAAAASGVTTISKNFFGPLGVANKTVAYIGNSTVWQDYGWFDTMCKQTIPNGIFAGMFCFSANSLSADSSNNVTITLCEGSTPCTNAINYGVTPVALTVGKFVSFESADATLGACVASFPVISSTSTTVVFNNSSCAAQVYADAGNSYNTPYVITTSTTISQQILNFGVNGGTLASALANTSSTGMGIGGVLAANPDLVIMRGYGINDVRTGGCNLACLEAEQKSWIDQLRFNNPKISQILIAENSLTNNAGCSAYITPTTSAQAYSQILEQATMSWTGYPTVITLDTQKTVYGTVSPTFSGVAAVALNSAGSSYAVNDIVTLASSGATLKVLTVSSGAIVTFQILTPGVSAVIASGVASTDSGTGTGATFNVTALTTDPYMAALPTGCLHPSTLGHQAETLQDVQFLTSLAYNAGMQTTPFSPFYANWAPASPYLAQYCRSVNYSVPWSVPGCANGWADPLYYTLIASGTALAQTAGASTLTFNWATPVAPPNVAQMFDVVQLQDGNTYQLPVSASTGYAGNFSTGVTRITATIPNATLAGEKLNILRPLLPQQACEVFYSDTKDYPYRRRIYIAAAGGATNLFNLSFMPSEGLNADKSNITTLGANDVVCFAPNSAYPGGILSLTGLTLSNFSTNNLRVSGMTCACTGLNGVWGIIFGQQPMEGAPDVNGKVTEPGGMALALGATYQSTHGTNSTAGVVTLTNGTVTVSTTAVTALAAAGGAGAVVVLVSESCSNCGILSIGTVTPGTSFVINSTNSLDASKVYWEIKGLN